MRPLLAIFFVFSASTLVRAQDQKTDSLSHPHSYDSAWLKPQQKLNSAESAISHRTDSLLSLNHKYDSALLKPQQKIDSLQNNFHQQTDSIQNVYHEKLSVLESVSSKFQRKIDSLKSFNLPTEKYTHKLDSVANLQQQTIAKAEQKIQALKEKTTGKLKSLDLPPELQSKVSDATKSIDGFNLPVKGLNIPSANISGVPGASLGKIGSTGIQSPLGNLPSAGNISGIGNELKDVQGEMKGITNATGEVGKYEKDLQNVVKGDLKDVKEAPKALEAKAADMSGMKDITGQTKELDQYKNELKQLQDPAKNKDELLQKGKQEAMNHFAGKEQVLQQAMDKISKYKQKYSSLQSIHDLPKRRPNEMKGKPLIERLMPGVALQIQKKGNDLLVDFNPYIGYRFTGKFTSGLGWNQRVAYNSKSNHFDHKDRVFGPRIYSEYNLFKGFFPRLELETMNTFVPTLLFNPVSTDFGRRQWVWTAFAGLKKDYRFLKSVKGTTMIMFNLYNPLHKSPYADVLNVRFGFEFPQKKKIKKSESQ